MRSRRRWKQTRISSTLSRGPRRAASAAAWLTDVALLVLWLCTVSSTLASAGGAMLQPTRQPVMA